MKTKKVQKNNYRIKLYILMMFCATLFMSVGYASIGSISMDLLGNVSVLSPNGLFISDIKVDELNTQSGINSSNITNGTFLNTNIILGRDLNSKITIIANVCNKNSDVRIFNSLRYMDLTDDELSGTPEFSNLYSNYDIVIDESSYSSYLGTTLETNECMDIPVTFIYKNNLESITENELSATINFKFDTIETYSSNITYLISSTTGTFFNDSTQLNYNISVTNNNPYQIKFDTIANSTEDIIVSGLSSDLIVESNSTTTTNFILSPAKSIYTSVTPIAFTIDAQVKSPITIDANTFTINVTPFGKTLAELINSIYTVNTTTPSFTTNVTTAANSGLFKTSDESGTTYYFRGVINNNYVYFANKYWRIVRINGDGSYRIVLDSSAGTSYFNNNTDYTYNVGYMYGSTVTSNSLSSDIKTYLETWYDSNLNTYDAYIDKDAIFWQDRTYDTSTKVYAGWERIVNNTPTMVATNKNDMFSVTKTKGNGLLSKPIGLLTGDEVVYAGGTMTGAAIESAYGTIYTNQNFYLYTGDYPIYGFWTMTPRRIGSSSSNNQIIVSKEVASIYSEPPTARERYVRPVINLKADLVFEGNGSETTPFKIVE